MKLEVKKDKLISLFHTGSYGCSGECSCGKFHYDTGNWWDDDHRDITLPMAEECAKDYPEKYQFHATAIEYVDFNGDYYVVGCSCGMIDFIFGILEDQKGTVFNYYHSTKDELTLADIGG